MISNRRLVTYAIPRATRVPLDPGIYIDSMPVVHEI
jgi:hypothetical protein